MTTVTAAPAPLAATAAAPRPLGAERVGEVADILREAGRHLLTFFRRDLSVRTKGGSSLVSEADESTERLLRAALATAFPGEPILGEEMGLDREPEGAWWIVDPLDGTTNFVAGLPLFCVAAARMEAGRATLAVIHDPVSGESFTATRGGGAALDGRPIAVARGEGVARPVLSLRHGSVRHHPALIQRLGTDKLRCLGAACLDLAFVACGRFDGMAVRKVRLWDVAAGALLVEEAGGVALHFDGSAFFPLRRPIADYVDLRTPIIAGPRAVAERLVRAFG